MVALEGTFLGSWRLVCTKGILRDTISPRGGGRMPGRTFQSLRFGALCAALSLAAPTAPAQVGNLKGLVIDSAGVPLGEVAVSIVSLHRATRTDSRGRFSLDRVPFGRHDVQVRRI